MLGLVEGITEFLPISSTGHLLITSRILDLPSAGKAGDAVKSFEIAIQFGAILAVLVLYRRRVLVMAEGLVGRSAEGRRLVTLVAIAFVPAALVGVISDKVIKDVLFGTWPVVAAWIVGGAAVIALSRTGRLSTPNGRGLDALTSRDAVVIGLAQVLALWPGTSRSLVTIVAALLLGASMSAAIEFSFLLGFVTLTAATGFETLTSGKLMVDTFGVAVPLLGARRRVRRRGRVDQVDDRVSAAARPVDLRVVPDRGCRARDRVARDQRDLTGAGATGATCPDRMVKRTRMRPEKPISRRRG